MIQSPVFSRLFLALAVFVGTSSPALSAKLPPPKAARDPHISQIKKVVAKYRSAKSVESSVEKTVTRSLLGDEKRAKGRFYFSKGRLRLELDDSDKTLLVADGKSIWMVSELPSDLGGGTHVTKMNLVRGKSKQAKKGDAHSGSSAVVALLFGDEKVWNDFEVKKVEEESKVDLKLLLEPKEAAGMPEIQSVQLWLNKDKREIRRISYLDDLDNRTSFDFEGTSFKAKVPKSKFEYRPPKDAQVTEL